MAVTTAFHRALRVSADVVSFLWDWPDVPGNRYTAKERQELDRLQRAWAAIFCATGSAATYALAPGTVTPLLIGGAVGLGVGQITGGLMMEFRRTRNTVVRPD